MSLADDAKKEIAAYQSAPLEDLTVQDTLVIIAVYAAQIDPEDCRENIQRIGGVLEKCEFCVECREKERYPLPNQQICKHNAGDRSAESS